ncbi:hypothetical protein GOBAR_AA03255 [Gossypium barbadense]|uniref:Uncharacterized protein n=1 Tax=Gossypium barbadense TaxID=3634 RepID=A0A2P5YNU5_GOSBA|nr:hypothetical protein GOBAR_AA03255 [Gossypium barbadense]
MEKQFQKKNIEQLSENRRYLELDEIDRRHSGTETSEGWSGEAPAVVNSGAGRSNGDGRRRKSKREIERPPERRRLSKGSGAGQLEVMSGT